MPLEACEMALLRVIHASELPDPGQLIEKLASGELAAPSPPSAGAPKGESQAELLRIPESFPELVQRLERAGKHILAHHLSDDFRLVSYAPPVIRLQAARPADTQGIEKTLNELRGFLKSAFQQSWDIGVDEGPALPSLREQELEAEEALRQEVLDAPIVRAAFEAFPEAELAGYAVDKQRSA
jgi:DNA polymerase-3 subunit gamma/tau